MEVLGAMDSTLRKSVRPKHTYARGPGGLTRCFGGMNLAFFIDLWQLPPVSRHTDRQAETYRQTQ